MVRHSYSADFDQNDPKVFRETLGTFGTTTVPGGNQLQELQTKIRQGVKNVELHLNNRAKGEMSRFDTPDKYGHEQRRTIMQLAKLNNQNLSVHSTLNVTSFSGLEQNGFNEASRWENIKEIDESIKFGAEVAKGGAVVIHLQGEGISSSRGELSLSSRYLSWLEKNRPEEYERVKNNYFKENPLERQFVDNPEKFDELKMDYENLDKSSRDNFERKHSEEISGGKNPWELYYMNTQKEKLKLKPDFSPFVVVGGQIEQVQRGQDFVDINVLKDKSNFTSNELSNLKRLGIDVGDDLSIGDFQKAMASFTNGVPKDLDIPESDFNKLKDKLLVTYDKVYEKNNFLQTQADSDFYKKWTNMNVDALDLQKKNLEVKHQMYQEELLKVRELESESKNLLNRVNDIKGDTQEDLAIRDALKQEISVKNREIQHLIHNSIGINEYQELANYDKSISEINKQKKELEEKSENSKSLADETFERNTSAIGYLGLKALKYQLDLIKNAKDAEKELPKLKDELSDLEKRYAKEQDREKQDELSNEISKLRTKVNKMVGLKDYISSDDGVDIKNNPLYASPENMLPGMGSLTNLEDFKAMLRMGQEDFANKILSNSDDTFKQIREDYEKVTGEKVDKSVAKELAKRHLSGTFDTAHAGAWLKHFKREKDTSTGKLESEENRLERFNKWLKGELDGMVKEGLVKHVHFNDTVGKDDDHSMLGQGVLDLHGLRETLRKAGVRDSLMVEFGGRSGFMENAFNMFGATLGSSEGLSERSTSGVSDWISVERNYNKRVEYSNYGMGQSTFNHIPPQQGRERGDWSGTGFF